MCCCFYVSSICGLHENIHAPRGTMSKNNLTGIILSRRPKCGIHALNLHNLLIWLNASRFSNSQAIFSCCLYISSTFFSQREKSNIKETILYILKASILPAVSMTNFLRSSNNLYLAFFHSILQISLYNQDFKLSLQVKECCGKIFFMIAKANDNLREGTLHDAGKKK